MNGLTLIWRLHKLLFRVASSVPGVRPVLRGLGLGPWLDKLIKRTIARRLPNPLVTEGLLLHYDSPLLDYNVLELAAGTYEKDTIFLVKRLLGPGMTMVDLGANIGYFSLIAARSVGAGGRVYAFEPQPGVYSVLLKNMEVNGCQDIIRPVRKAISNVVGSAAVFLCDWDSGQASLYRQLGSEKVLVETTTLDAFFEKEGWPPVNLIKMDIEGAEKEALEGMQELAMRNPSLKLIMEFNLVTAAAAGVTAEELFGVLSSLGFRRLFPISPTLEPLTIPQLQPLTIPQDVSRLVSIVKPKGTVNVLCEK